MSRYLFVTYGEPGWRGVQIRGLRIASYLPKKDVLFWNLYDSKFIADEGFKVETKQPGVVNPEQIIFPEGVEIVVFTDLPTNEFFQYCIWQAALAQKKKIVVCEQIYRRGQLKEGVYKKISENCDLFLVNALSYFKSEETNIVKILPPQIEHDFTPETRRRICRKYDLEEDALILFGVGYHESVLEKIKQITARLERKRVDFYTVVTGSSKIQEGTRRGRLVILPYDIGADFFKLMYSADLLLVKFGFLQILEGLALGKPTIVLGEGGFTLRTPEKLDTVYQNTLRFDLEITEETFAYIEKFIVDNSFRRRLQAKVKKLHNGELFGARKAADYLKHLRKKKTKKKVYRKKIALLVNNEIFVQENWLKKQEDIYPFCLVTGMPTAKFSNKRIPEKVLNSTIRELNIDWSKEVLPHSFKHIFVFSERRLDGFTDVMPWFDRWVRNIENLLAEADVIYVSDQGLAIFNPLLLKCKAKVKRLC